MDDLDLELFALGLAVWGDTGVPALVPANYAAFSADLLSLIARVRAAEERADRLQRLIAQIATFVRPPRVRSVAGIHSGSEQLLVVKGHRWKSFLKKAGIEIKDSSHG